MRSPFNYRFGLPSPFYDNETGSFSPAALFALAEPGVWYDPSDLTALFQESNGVTSVTTPGNTVGLMLDKSKGLVAGTKGGQMDGIVGGSFDTPSATANQITGDIDIRVRASLVSWTPAATTTLCSRVLTGVSTGDSYEFWINTSGVLQLLTVSGTTTTNVASSASVGFAAGTTNWVRVTWQQSTGYVNFFTSSDGVTWTQNGTANRAGTTSATNAGSRPLRLGARSDGVSGSFPLNGKIYRAQIYNGINGTLAVDFNPTLYTSGATYTAATGEVWTITGLYARIVPDGNHATQGTIASRPTYGVVPQGGRRNILTWSEDFRNTATAGETRPWVYDAATVSANTTVAPDGTMTADTLFETAINGTHRIYQGSIAVPTGSSLTATVRFKQQSVGRNLDLVILSSGAFISTIFSSTDGSVVAENNVLGGIFSEKVSSVSGPDAYGFYTARISASTSSTLTFTMFVGMASGTTNAYLGDITKGIIVWGAQLEQSATATPYQKVTTQYDVTEAGVPSCSYLFFDGAGDNMATGNIDFTATNKVTIWTGHRMIDQTGSGVILEVSSNAFSTVGGFSFVQGPTISNTGLGSLMNTGAGIGAQTAPLALPYTSVSTLQLNSSLVGVANEIALRMNATTMPMPATSGTDSGTGNFGNYPLYIGARATATVPVKGEFFGFIVRGAASTATQITSTEQWLAPKSTFFRPVITGVPTVGVS